MKYGRLGNGTSAVEVTNISKHGFWLLIHDQELFLPFDGFPWFRDAPVGKIIHVELASDQHLYWPELDVDLEVESILNPERHPLISKVSEAGEGYADSREEPYDEEKVDDAVLALLQLTLHDGSRAWKGFNFGVMDRLFEKGYLLNPANKTKSVVLTDTGMARSKELFDQFFGNRK